MPPNPRPSALGAARNQLSEIISAIERLHKNWCWERSHGQACSGCAASDKAIADLLEIFTRRAQEAVEAATPGIERKAKVEGLHLALQQIPPYQLIGECNSEWVNARMQIRSKIEAEITKLEAQR